MTFFSFIHQTRLEFLLQKSSILPENSEKFWFNLTRNLKAYQNFSFFLFFFFTVHQNSFISQAFQFFVPIGPGAGLHLPSSMFIGQTSDKRASPDLSADEQLACHWKKVDKSWVFDIEKPLSPLTVFMKCFPSFSATCSLTLYKILWTMSTTSMWNLRRILGTAATGRAVLAKEEGLMPGDEIIRWGL